MLLFDAGRTVIFSNPDACPDIFIPNVYTLPLMDMEVGVVDPRVALPPEIANTKSSFKRSATTGRTVYGFVHRYSDRAVVAGYLHG